MKTTFFLLVWLIPIWVNVEWDKDGRKPVYAQMFILRGMAAFSHWLLFVRSPDQMPLLAWLLVFEVTSFWLVFEIWLNLRRGNALLYYDTVEKDSGYIDRFFAWAGQGWHFVAKVSALALMIYCIIRVYALA